MAIHMARHMRIFAFSLLFILASASIEAAAAGPVFEISFPRPVHSQPITGRVFLIISHHNEPEVRLQTNGINSPPLFGLDVNRLEPGQPTIVDAAVPGYPLESLRDIPSGDYYVQALLNVYTEFHRADGHTIWAHMDQWEGQHFNTSPGNLYSKPQKLHLDTASSHTIQLSLSEVIPAVQVPRDTQWVKYLKIQSPLLSRFWGRPIYLGAVVLLPRGYDSQPDLYYPVVYEQGHFYLSPPLGFNEKLTQQDEFSKAWSGERFPRVIAVRLLHPSPYYDESYVVNSANNGPYADAILTELIPYIERKFRIIREPYARVLTGGSAGGENSLTLQVMHPELFGGTWSLCPSEIDLRSYYVMNIYEDRNAFTAEPQGVLAALFRSEWTTQERVLMRTEDGQPVATVRQQSRLESVLGSRGRGGSWFDPAAAAFSPVGEEGYPEPLLDKVSGTINHEVARHWREHGYDLREYAEKHWAQIGPHLIDKLHIYVGDMDEFYVNSGVYLFEQFLENTQNPHYAGSFEYGRPMKGHTWQPMSHAQLVEAMADHIASHAPPGADLGWR